MVEQTQPDANTELLLSPNSIKAKPPFPPLPSFAPNALVLGYLAYAEEVSELLNLLSSNAKKYGEVHHAILGSFLEEMPVDMVWSQIARRAHERQPLVLSLSASKYENRNEAFTGNLAEFQLAVKQNGRRDEDQIYDYLNKYYEDQAIGESLRNGDNETIVNFISSLSKQEEESLYFRLQKCKLIFFSRD